MCTLLLKETCAYYTSNKSKLRCVVLDATKAFDKVEYSILFRKLIKQLPPVVIRFFCWIFTYVKFPVKGILCSAPARID